jgi:hypothetical protein
MTDAPPPLTGEFVVDAGYPARVAAVTAGETLRTPWPWLGLATAVLGAGLALLGGPEWLWIVAGVALFVALFLPLVTYLLIRQVGRRQFPPGSVLRIGFGDQFLSAQTPMESSTTAYATFSGAKRRGDFVLLRNRSNRAWSAVPGQLFTDEDLARFPQS